MAAYIVVNALITDVDGFKPYARAVPPLVQKFGGEYLVIGGEHEPLEGDWGPTRLVIHRWTDMDAARRFWTSPEYQEAKTLRAGTGRFSVMLVDGVSNETLE